MPAATYAEALALVKAAIGRIKASVARFREVERIPTLSERARIDAAAAIMEFSHQWENVDLIIRERGL